MVHYSERSWELQGLFPIIPCWAGSGVYGKFVSTFPTCFDVGIFSVVHCVGVTHLVSEFLSEEIALCVSIYSVNGRREIQEPPVSPSWSRSYFKYDY